MVHSNNHAAEPELLILPHAHAMDELLRRHLSGGASDPPHVFFAGGGAYTQPRALASWAPEATIEVAEIDPAVTRTAHERLFVDMQGITVHEADARIQLPKSAPDSLDAIVTDVFHDVAVPYHLTTAEFIRVAASRLKPDGLYVANVVDVFPDSRLVKAIIKVLEQEFETVQVWLEEPPSEPTRLTYIVSATNGRPFPPQLSATTGFTRTWFDVAAPVRSIGTPMEEIPLLTDDYAPVERLVSTLFWSEMGL